MDARLLAERVARLRGVEDAALAQWRSACSAHDRAVAHRARVVGWAEAAVRRAMRPVLPHHYVRIEALLDAGPQVILARPRGWALAAVYHTRRAVNESRDRLAATRAVQDTAVAAARDTRGAATARLMDAWTYPDGATGVSMQRLAMMRAGR